MNNSPHQPVLVTGATGFIGRRLVRRLIERRCPVWCLVRAGSLSDDLRAEGAQLITGDVTDRSSVERALVQSQPGTVFHLAGLVRALHRDDFMRVNAQGVETVATACAARAGASTPPVLVVVSSLSAVGPVAADRLCVEGDAPAPVSDYGRSKLAGELAAARFAGTVPITIVRPSIVFGPGDQGVLEIFRPIARQGFHIVPGAKGTNHRFSMVHVDDLVEGLLLAAEKGERLLEIASPGQGIYFIAGDECPTYAQLGKAIAIALGKKPPTIIHVPGPLLKLFGLGGDILARLRRQPGWISTDKITEALAGSWTCSSVKARTQLGWSPAADLAHRLHQTAQWYRDARWL